MGFKCYLCFYEHTYIWLCSWNWEVFLPICRCIKESTAIWHRNYSFSRSNICKCPPIGRKVALILILPLCKFFFVLLSVPIREVWLWWRILKMSSQSWLFFDNAFFKRIWELFVRPSLAPFSYAHSSLKSFLTFSRLKNPKWHTDPIVPFVRTRV